MRTIRTKVYKFEELNDYAKNEAIEQYQEKKYLEGKYMLNVNKEKLTDKALRIY